MSKKPNPERVDDDNPEWTTEDFRQAKTFAHLPKTLQDKLRQTRGPNKTPTKERITIRLSPEVVQYFRASGDGWQARIDAALKEWVVRHPH